MGAILSAGLSLRWFRETFCPEITFEQLSHETSETPSAGDLLFHPYLPGKRSPDLNPSAYGAFSGIRLHHKRGHFVRAIMEGVVFDLKESLDVMEKMGVVPKTCIASGGGAQSGVWMQIMADILEQPLQVHNRTEQACFGAALVAGIGTGVYENYWKAVELVPEPAETVTPLSENAERYQHLYGKFLRMYKDTMTG